MTIKAAYLHFYQTKAMNQIRIVISGEALRNLKQYKMYFM